MKHLFLILCAICLSLHTFAEGETTTIHLQKEISYGENRSLFMDIVACHEQEMIYLTSDKEYYDVIVKVTDASGNIIFEGNFALLPNETYSFSIGDVENDTYQLIILTEEARYQGYFTLTE